MAVTGGDFGDATTAQFRDSLVAWIDDHRAQLEPPYEDHGSTDEILSHQRQVQRLLFEQGWMRWGWPAAVGGLGGSRLFRAVLGEELTGRGLVHSAAYSMTEVLGPAVVEYASVSLAAEVVPPMLRGDETWCQGFSEPEAGSDLGSLRTTAVMDGEAWVLQGQKLWTSWAHHAARCIVLARTEGPDTGSRGISAFFVDMDSAGVSVHPLDTMAGVDEFCETFFDEVRVPQERLLGSQGQGWRVAQHILACERGPIFWQRASWLLHHLGEIATMADASDAVAQRLIGLAFADVSALRARSRSTQERVAAGDLWAAESSIDKILIAAADQVVFEAARHVLPGVVELGDSPLADRYRKEWAYSRAATIYGGTSEIQKDIVASRLLNLPKVP
jgi:alkylation response protein AidB-like acyl-CoA dehydrogenase